MLRAYKVRKLKLTDHQKLASVPIQKSDHPVFFINAVAQKKLGPQQRYLDSMLSESETAAFIVIRNDSLLYERYDMGFTRSSILPSNSMAKSFTGTLVGIAIKEGKIKSDLEPVTTYLPELGKRDPRFHLITIRHLLDMRSGLLFKEGSYNLWDDAVRSGFRPHLQKHILKIKIAEPPGKFNYQSINTQLLGLIIQRATGTPLQSYLEEKLWKPMGAEFDATWNIDSKKRRQVMISAGLNATAVDFAKLGRLYLNGGATPEGRIVDASWVRTVGNTDSMEKYEGYKSQWWNRRISTPFKDSLRAVRSRRSKKYARVHKEENSYTLSYRTDAFSAIGFMNQIIYVHAKKKLIIVRLGRKWSAPLAFTGIIFTLGEQL
jgi:CubicO group peptidase (beta-lactamase class C family)